MKKITIGSVAIKHYFDDFDRVPNDIDYAVDVKDVKRSRETEYLYNPVLLKYASGDYATPEQLLTLKMSHLSWDIKWKKHMHDAIFLMNKGIKYDKDLYDELLVFWKEIHGEPRKSDLTLEADDFFDNAINGKNGLDHDYIHTLINPTPLYTRILKENKSVETDVLKWNLLSFEDKCNLVKEEVMVMAYERFSELHHVHAYNMMLEKFVKSHAPEWMVEFIILNYQVLIKPGMNFIKTINDGQRANGNPQ